jgi:hypothetical protein
MRKFRKRPVEIEAMTFTEVEAYSEDHWHGKADNVVTSFDYKGHLVYRAGDSFVIPTSEGEMTMQRDDMLITGVNGEIYPCKPDIFAKTYDEVTDATA